MKRIKNVFLTLMICVMFTYAEKPNGQKIKEIVDVTIEKLNNDIQLTDSQKIKLREYATIYYSRIDSVNELTDEQKRISMRKEISDNYNAFCDSLLTSTQQVQRQVNLELRKRNAKKKQ